MWKSAISSLFFCTLLAVMLAQNIIQYSVKYTAETFSAEVPKENNFIMFYAPWCGHSRRLEPTWEELAEMYNKNDSTIIIGKVDCTDEYDLCSSNDIGAYPTMKLFKVGEIKAVRYYGRRDIPSFTSFINIQLEKETVSSTPETVNDLMELTEDTLLLQDVEPTTSEIPEPLNDLVEPTEDTLLFQGSESTTSEILEALNDLVEPTEDISLFQEAGLSTSDIPEVVMDLVKLTENTSLLQEAESRTSKILVEVSEDPPHSNIDQGQGQETVYEAQALERSYDSIDKDEQKVAKYVNTKPIRSDFEISRGIAGQIHMKSCEHLITLASVICYLYAAILT